MIKSSKLAFPLAVISAAIFQATHGIAQEAAALEEILVTAQRREQNLQEVPISVSAFTGDSLEQRNIKSAIDYLALTLMSASRKMALSAAAVSVLPFAVSII